jgi:hypothetical protein
MSIVETVLVYVGIPLGLFAVFAVVVLGPGAARSPRYRPGSAWDYKPVWYLPHPAHTQPVSSLHAAGTLEAGTRRAVHGAGTEHTAQPTGGASGEW